MAPLLSFKPPLAAMKLRRVPPGQSCHLEFADCEIEDHAASSTTWFDIDQNRSGDHRSSSEVCASGLCCKSTPSAQPYTHLTILAGRRVVSVTIVQFLIADTPLSIPVPQCRSPGCRSADDLEAGRNDEREHCLECQKDRGGSHTIHPADRCNRRIRAGDYFSTTNCRGRRRRRELLGSRVSRESRGGSPAAGMDGHVVLLSPQRVCRSRRRPRTRVRDRPNPRQPHRERERKPPSESRSGLLHADLHLRYARVWRAAYCRRHWNIWPHQHLVGRVSYRCVGDAAGHIAILALRQHQRLSDRLWRCLANSNAALEQRRIRRPGMNSRACSASPTISPTNRPNIRTASTCISIGACRNF